MPVLVPCTTERVAHTGGWFCRSRTQALLAINRRKWHALITMERPPVVFLLACKALCVALDNRPRQHAGSSSSSTDSDSDDSDSDGSDSDDMPRALPAAIAGLSVDTATHGAAPPAADFNPVEWRGVVAPRLTAALAALTQLCWVWAPGRRLRQVWSRLHRPRHAVSVGFAIR